MAFAYGQRGRDLLQQLKRSDWLPEFDEDGFRAVISEINALHQDITSTLRAESFQIRSTDIACNVDVHHMAMLRDKRCLLAYLEHRARKMRAMRWETGTVVPEGAKGLLHTAELEYFHKYDSLVTEYMGHYGLDLTADLTPPKDLYVEIRVLRDCGEVVTDTGVVNLELNTTHYLRRADVDHLIRQGLLEQIDHQH